MDRPIINGLITTQTSRKIPMFNQRGGLLGVKKWLVEQAIAEASANHNDFVLFQFQQMNLNNLSPADCDSINDYLFGETYPRFRRI
jgi:hypothetical protein